MLDLGHLGSFLTKLKEDAEAQEVGKILISTVVQFHIFKEMFIEILGDEGEAFDTALYERFQERLKQVEAYQQAKSGVSLN